MSSKINLQTCEYACKSSIFQDNQLIFYKQIILQRGLPFDVKIPSSRPVDMSSLSETELSAELEKGYADIKAGRTREANAAFADIRKDYNL